MTSENSMHLERAAALLELRRPAEARQILEQLIASDPSDAAAMVLLARCHVQLGDDDGAIEWSRRAGAAAPDDLALLLDCSSVARTAGNASDAYAWAIRALSMAPTSVRALNLVSLAEVGIGMDGPAIGHAAAALEQAPDDLDLRVGYALALSASGRVADATVQYVQVLEQAPTHVYALNNLASLRLGVGDLRRSIRLFGRALAIDPRLQIAARNIDAAAVSGRRILASHLAIGLGVVGAGRQTHLAWTYLVGAAIVVWTVWSFLRLPAGIRRRFTRAFGWWDLADGFAYVMGLGLAFGFSPDDPDFQGGYWWLIFYGSASVVGLGVRRGRLAVQLRRAGVRLP